jgi:hypothetical protein
MVPSGVLKRPGDQNGDSPTSQPTAAKRNQAQTDQMSSLLEKSIENLTKFHDSADPTSASNPLYAALISLTTLIQLQHQTVSFLLEQNSSLHVKLDRLLARNDNSVSGQAFSGPVHEGNLDSAE